jgi:hypothetical protein
MKIFKFIPNIQINVQIDSNNYQQKKKIYWKIHSSENEFSKIYMMIENFLFNWILSFFVCRK